MVQEARLDLSRPAALIALALIAGPAAFAQPLVPNPGLTSLLQPQRLDRSRPLLPEDRGVGSRLGAPLAGPAGSSPCDRRAPAGQAGTSPPRPGSSLYGGGSGPGDYGQFVPGAPSPSSANRGVAADRPLYGGIDRPLWNTGERGAAPKTGKAASPDESGRDRSGAATAQAGTIPAPVRDRPLWATGSSAGSAASGADSASGGIAPTTCMTSSAPLLPQSR